MIPLTFTIIPGFSGVGRDVMGCLFQGAGVPHQGRLNQFRGPLHVQLDVAQVPWRRVRRSPDLMAFQLASYGCFYRWGYPKIDGISWKILLKWMMNRGTPILGNLHILVLKKHS